jgi:hypothetical protein
MKFTDVSYPIIISPARILELFVVTNTKQGMFLFILRRFVCCKWMVGGKKSKGCLTLRRSQALVMEEITLSQC